MKLFINNKRVRFISDTDPIKSHDYDVIVDATFPIQLNEWRGKVLITHVSQDKMLSILKLLELDKLRDIQSISFWVNDVEQAEKEIKKSHKIVKAAGGIVVHRDQLLMIYRMGKWDFPKGKIENTELTAKAAEREVLEECGVACEVIEKICSTWHTYTDKEKKVLKKTTWYVMETLGTSATKPQTEEGIEKVEWVSLMKAEENLENSYASLAYVFKKFKKMKLLSQNT